MSTVDMVEAVLRERMLRGDVEPGLRVRQDELAAELGVSKIPVREALQRLAAAGLLLFESNRGAIVPALNMDDAAENYALRRSIEPQLLDRALDRMSVVDLAEAEWSLDSPSMSVPESNWAFHRALYRPGGWSRGLAIAEMLHAAVAPYVRLYTEQLGGATDSDAEHRRLLEACRQGARGAANSLLKVHLDRAERALVAYLGNAAESGGP
ncbi:MAG: GntR family transcriptional regulator [Actinomycetota bacterium]